MNMLKKIKFMACALALSAAILSAGCTVARSDGGNAADDNMTVYITVGEESAEIKLGSGNAAQQLAERLAEGDIVYAADDYGGFEKVGALGFSLPRSDERITTQPGDVMLYQGDSIVIFYGSNSWAYTPLGRIQGLAQQDLRGLLQAGRGQVQVTLSLFR